MGLTDSFSRKINYLRLSVTDRCNMRCQYCMPPEGIPVFQHSDIVSYEDMLLIAEAAVTNGIEKIRLTGGEPLVRKGILGFIKRLSLIPGLKELVLTTNALLLREMAAELHEAGVQRLNISLDSLHPETFATITRGADLQRVLAGIQEAERVGLPVKINMVVMAGVNDHELLDFVDLTLTKPVTVRFIEYMPVIRQAGWEAKVVPGREIMQIIASRHRFTAQSTDGLSGPASIYRILGAAGCFGVITAVSGHFCADCNRIRVTSSGTVRGCLFSDESIDLRPLLAAGNREGIESALQSVVTRKPRNHTLTLDESGYTPFAMAAIGG